MLIKQDGKKYLYVGFSNEDDDWYVIDKDGNEVNRYFFAGKTGYNTIIYGKYYLAINKEEIKKHFSKDIKFFIVEEAMKMIPQRDKWLFKNILCLNPQEQ